MAVQFREAEADLRCIAESAEFKEAIGADSCVPDGYAQVSALEDFAQLVVLASYDVNVSGGLGKITSESGCLGKQLQYVKDRVGDRLTQGGSCTGRWDPA